MYCSVCKQDHDGTGCPIDQSVYDDSMDVEAVLKKIAALTIERNRMIRGLRNVIYQGHNDDCLFCGFKDRIAQAALQTEGGA
jgi:hypothetical protein